MTEPVTAFTHTRETFENAFENLFSGPPETAEADLLRLVVPTYWQTTEDRRYEFADFVVHMQNFRKAVKHVEVEMHQFLRDGNQIADRHTVYAALKDGSNLELEVMLFGEVSGDGRMAWIVEKSEPAKGNQKPQNWG